MEKKIKIQVRDLNLYYGQNHALHGVNMDIKENSVTALIGPSGCVKSTFLKCINRMNDLVDNVRIEGSIEIDGENIYAPSVDTTVLRKKVGMVFQQPNPFPMSIYDNIAIHSLCCCPPESPIADFFNLSLTSLNIAAP